MLTDQSESENNRTLPRKEREKLHRRREILLAAREVFARRGFSSATLDEIAETAELGKGTLYNYFQSKEELFDDVLIDSLEELHAIALEGCMNGNGGFHQCYRDVARAVVEHVYANREFFSFIMREVHRPAHKDIVQAHFPKIISVLEAPLRDALPATMTDNGFAKRVAYVFLTIVFALVQSRMQASFIGCADDDASADAPVSAPNSEVIDNILSVIDVTFFSGIRSMIPEPEAPSGQSTPSHSSTISMTQ